MKGIILAGGSGTRLYPTTFAVSKHLLPIYDKPMIYYSLSSLLLSNIQDILIISDPQSVPLYQKLLGDGSQFGVKFSYSEQRRPRGIAEALILGEEFIDGDHVALILGDNFFYGASLSEVFSKVATRRGGATIFGYYVNNPVEFGVVEFDETRKVISLEEKPKKPKSNYAIPGFYFYDQEAVELAKELTPSARGELEITDLNIKYLEKKKLYVEILGRGVAWLDTGTPHGLLQAANFVEAIQSRQRILIASPEEIAFRKGFIDKEQLLALADKQNKSDYGKYLRTIVK